MRNVLTVSISEGNVKLGEVPSFSMPPGYACSPIARKTCFMQGCYAVNMCSFRTGTARAWAGNYLLATHDPNLCFQQINDWLDEHRPSHFRWHIGGDFLSQSYLDRVFDCAVKHKKIKFLAFSKRHDLDFRDKPKNLNVVFSQWPGIANTATHGKVPMAWMQSKFDPDQRIPKDAIPCGGDCQVCFLCWKLKPGESVVFHKH